MIDIGVNLTNKRFSVDRSEVIIRAQQAGITAMLVTGTNVEESEQAIELCQQHPQFLFSTCGVHPHDADGVSNNYLEQLKVLSQSEHVKAIGECGLDFNRNFSHPTQQKLVFSQQIELAIEQNLPLFLHQRDAFPAWLEILLPNINKVPAMVSHCFTGSLDEARQCLDHGMYIGITGWLCDERRGQSLRELVRYIPLDRLMLETDAPYLTPRTIRPRPKSSRNEPAYLHYVVKMLSELTDYSESDIIQQTTKNSHQVFSLGAEQC